MPDAAAVHAQLAVACSRVTTLTAELGLSGRAGRDRLRGRVLAGFRAPQAMRLEGVAPFGAPAFILAARGDRAILLLPRDNSVLQDAGPQEILGALTGVSLAPADVRAILTGCVLPDPQIQGGSLYADGWASIALAAGSTLYLRRADSSWRVRAARRPGWRIEYSNWAGDFPRTVRLRSEADSGAATVDLTVEISQLETNVDIAPEAFNVTVPASALPITLEELRRVGPLR